jgi:outer membrane protein
MMKKLLGMVLLNIALFAQDLTLGLGGYFQTQPYKDTDTIVVPSPVIFYDNGIVYARWTRFGVYFYGHKASDMSGDLSWGFSLTAQPRPNGYSPDDSKALQGLDEKKTSVEGGLAFTVYGGDAYLEAMLITDLLDRYDSYIGKIETGLKYKWLDITFYPSIVFVYESEKFTQYYYGISQEEAQRTSYDIYQPNGGLRVAAQTYINYPIYKQWALFFNLRVDRLTNNAKNSPIVADDFVYSGLASLTYTFK